MYPSNTVLIKNTFIHDKLHHTTTNFNSYLSLPQKLTENSVSISILDISWCDSMGILVRSAFQARKAWRTQVIPYLSKTIISDKPHHTTTNYP